MICSKERAKLSHLSVTKENININVEVQNGGLKDRLYH